MRMIPGLVSIIMPVYNAAPYVARAIESALAQKYPHWQLIVVNDGSTDGSVDVLACYRDPRIQVIHQPNGGESAARNTALDHVEGEFIAFLDADDEYLPHHLSVTVRYLQVHPECDAVYTDGYYCDAQGVRLQLLSARRRGPFQGRIFEEVVRAPDVFGPPGCVVLRSNVVLQHDLRFDTAIVIGPDWDFLIRCADVAQFGYVDERTYLYRVHQTNITIRATSQKRISSLVRCRSKAVQMESFRFCSLETQWAAFYDLLIHLLNGFPHQQTAVTQWPAFRSLPAARRAQLFRLMASQAILMGRDDASAKAWLRVARELAPQDWRGLLLATLLGLSPTLCRLLLQVKRLPRFQASLASPFDQVRQPSSR